LEDNSAERAEAPAPAAEAPAASAARLPYLWTPALALWAAALSVLAVSLPAHDFVRAAAFAQNAALTGLSGACLALAAALSLVASWRAAAVRHLDALGAAPPRAHALWLAAAYGGLWAWLGFIRWCEYRGYLLALDTAVTINEAHNFIRHGALYMSVFGVHPLSIHFDFLPQMLSPALRAWNSPLAVIFLEDALLFSAPIAVYALIFSRTRSSLAGFCGFWLAASTPYFYELLGSNAQVTAAAVLFAWAMFFFDRRPRWPAGLLLLAMLGSTEAMPLTLFGLGLYFIAAPRPETPRGWKLGLAVCAASAAVWLAEMAVIRHYGAASRVNFAEGYWAIFSGLVPAGTPAASILREILLHPLRDLALLFSSRYRFYHVLRVLFYMGLLPLAAPAATLPFWTTVFPYILAAPTAPIPFLRYVPHLGYADFLLHEGAYMFAPLLWATARGIERADSSLRPAGRRGWLLTWVLLIAGLGFANAQRTLPPDWRPWWFDAMPRAAALIPPGARVWADGYAAAAVSNRRWLKVTGWGPLEPSGFESDLFRPDYVLIDKAFVRVARPPYRDRLLAFLGAGGYRKAFDESGVLLLASPRPAPSPEDVPSEWISLPPPDPDAARAYARYLAAEPGRIEPGSGAPAAPAADPAEDANDRAGTLARKGRLDEAIALYREALRARPDFAEARNNLGAALAGKGDLDAAIREYREALRVRPAYADARNNLGAALAEQGRLDEAIGEVRLALKADPGSASARANLEVLLKLRARRGR
jgi:hypothetical protein